MPAKPRRSISPAISRVALRRPGTAARLMAGMVRGIRVPRLCRRRVFSADVMPGRRPGNQGPQPEAPTLGCRVQPGTDNNGRHLVTCFPLVSLLRNFSAWELERAQATEVRT